ncbi:MAG: hypothetical protein LBE20_02075 [Deltaproteobacteria bacterium]|jgi:hypothetical protein|nr:hypothetical protein [Deltaproteobacteria bacterium]
MLESFDLVSILNLLSVFFLTGQITQSEVKKETGDTSTKPDTKTGDGVVNFPSAGPIVSTTLDNRNGEELFKWYATCYKISINENFPEISAIVNIIRAEFNNVINYRELREPNITSFISGIGSDKLDDFLDKLALNKGFIAAHTKRKTAHEDERKKITDQYNALFNDDPANKLSDRLNSKDPQIKKEAINSLSSFILKIEKDTTGGLIYSVTLLGEQKIVNSFFTSVDQAVKDELLEKVNGTLWRTRQEEKINNDINNDPDIKKLKKMLFVDGISEENPVLYYKGNYDRKAMKEIVESARSIKEDVLFKDLKYSEAEYKSKANKIVANYGGDYNSLHCSDQQKVIIDTINLLIELIKQERYGN